MRAQSWTNILNLLAVMIVANKDDAMTELNTFKRGAMLIKTLIGPEIRFTEALAADWFIENRANVRRQATSVHYDKTVSELLQGLNMLPNKPIILTALMKGALTENVSNNDYVFAKASTTWGLDERIAA